VTAVDVLVVVFVVVVVVGLGCFSGENKTTPRGRLASQTGCVLISNACMCACSRAWLSCPGD
jgi:hypothetical protein